MCNSRRVSYSGRSSRSESSVKRSEKQRGSTASVGLELKCWRTAASLLLWPHCSIQWSPGLSRSTRMRRDVGPISPCVYPPGVPRVLAKGTSGIRPLAGQTNPCPLIRRRGTTAKRASHWRVVCPLLIASDSIGRYTPTESPKDIALGESNTRREIDGRDSALSPRFSSNSTKGHSQ